METGRRPDPQPKRSKRHQPHKPETGITRRKLLIGVAATAAVASLGGTAYLLSEQSKHEPTLREQVLSFTWEDANSEERFHAFVELLANEYLKSTKTTRVTKNDLLGPAKTNFYKTTTDFKKGVATEVPDFTPTKTQWGHTHYASKRVFIDLENLKRQAPDNAGLALIEAIWHEWGHLDVSERTTGELLNRKDFVFPSPISGSNEEFRKYRGGTVYTDTYYGFLRFDEVWNDTITFRRIIEALRISGDETVIGARDYWQNGTDFFPLFTSQQNISLQTLYQMHATSDFEGFAKLIGEKLPGNKPPLLRGMQLFIGIHQANTNLIRQSLGQTQ